jgi:hypothetical protein
MVEQKRARHQGHHFPQEARVVRGFIFRILEVLLYVFLGGMTLGGFVIGGIVAGTFSPTQFSIVGALMGCVVGFLLGVLAAGVILLLININDNVQRLVDSAVTQRFQNGTYAQLLAIPDSWKYCPKCGHANNVLHKHCTVCHTSIVYEPIHVVK